MLPLPTPKCSYPLDESHSSLYPCDLQIQPVCGKGSLPTCEDSKNPNWLSLQPHFQGSRCTLRSLHFSGGHHCLLEAALRLRFVTVHPGDGTRDGPWWGLLGKGATALQGAKHAPMAQQSLFRQEWCSCLPLGSCSLATTAHALLIPTGLRLHVRGSRGPGSDDKWVGEALVLTCSLSCKSPSHCACALLSAAAHWPRKRVSLLTTAPPCHRWKPSTNPRSLNPTR